MIWPRIQANIQRERETDLKKRKICDDEFTAYLCQTPPNDQQSTSSSDYNYNVFEYEHTLRMNQRTKFKINGQIMNDGQVNKASEKTSHLNSNLCTLFRELTDFFSGMAAMISLLFLFSFSIRITDDEKYSLACKMLRFNDQWRLIRLRPVVASCGKRKKKTNTKKIRI